MHKLNTFFTTGFYRDWGSKRTSMSRVVSTDSEMSSWTSITIIGALHGIASIENYVGLQLKACPIARGK